MIKSYTEFINENVSDIFKSAHGAIEPSELIPLSILVGKKNFPSEEEIDEIYNYLDIDKEYLFYNPNDFLNKFCYWKGPVYYGFIGLTMEALRMMRAKEYIKQLNDFFEKAFIKKDYESIFTRIDKKILIPTFIEMFSKIPDNQKYDVFINLYVRSEYGFGTFPKEMIIKCFSLRKLSKDWKKRMSELKTIIKDQKEVTIYRGMNVESAKPDHAFSWTLSKKTAEYFSNRFNKGRGKVISKIIDPSEIIDYIEDRGESEIIVLPHYFK